MPPAVATAALLAAAARALHEAGHPVVAEALQQFLIGADFEAALGLRPGWRAYPRYEAQQKALTALLQALPPTPFAVRAATQLSQALCRYHDGGWRADQATGRRPNGVLGLAYDCLSAGVPTSIERLRKRLPALVTEVEAVTNHAA